MFHELLTTWFEWVEKGGYPGVFMLMAAESSIIPVPSEVVMPPAAYWATQGKMNMFGVVAAGTLGSWFGSSASYWVSRWVGLPFLERYGKYVLITPEKLALAHGWVERYGTMGIFIARLLPVIRHLISIPAGIVGMDFKQFSLATTVGAGIWCAVLSWFGAKTLGAHPELLDSPETMIHAIKSEMHWFVLGVVALAAMYAVVVWQKSRVISKPEAAS